MHTHYNFILYPEAIKKLKDSKLDEKVTRALRNKTVSLVPSIIYDPAEATWMLDSVKERGFFKTIPFNFVQDFGEDSYQDWHQDIVRLIDRAVKKEPPFWEITRSEGKQYEPTSLESDLPLLTGYNASAVLTPEEFWQFREFGFNSLHDFFGVVGAFTGMKDKEYMDRGYTWQSTDGEKTFKFDIGGSEHGDFRLKKVDITPYLTLDPTAREVFYRPETSKDVQYVSASHSVEPELLAILLKWADQEKIDSKILKNYPEFISSIKSQGQLCGPFADFGFPSGIPRYHFASWDYNLPRLEESNERNLFGYAISCYGADQGGYTANIGKSHQLVLSYFSPERKIRESGMSIPPTNLDNFIEGLFHQAQRGLGRTSVKNLDDVVKYYLSPQFKSDREQH